VHPRWTTNLDEAINNAETDVVVIGLPNNLHEQAALAAAKAKKAVLCTKPLARTGDEALRILHAVESAGVFHGYLEDLVYTPKTLKAIQSVQNGALGKVLWARSRETHPGPHSDWFWDKEQSGGGAIVDMGCHCIEISRSFIGKRIRPLEVMCWADSTPIEAEDSAVGLVRFASGAVGQSEVSWTFRVAWTCDEVSGTRGRSGSITGCAPADLFTSVGERGYVAEKAEGATGWLFRGR
jgi:predicted dehydrogenase